MGKSLANKIGNAEFDVTELPPCSKNLPMSPEPQCYRFESSMYSGLRSHKVNAGHTCVNNLIGALCEVCSL